MRFPLSSVLAVISLTLRVTAQAPIDLSFNTFTPSTYVDSTGLTDLVQWDGYSLFVKGQRLYVYSGEIHSEWTRLRNLVRMEIADVASLYCLLFNSLLPYFYNLPPRPALPPFRKLGPYLPPICPLPDVRMVNSALYPDLMQRIKGLGFNAISSYFFWGLHNPSPGVFDFDGWKSLEPFFRAANDAGLFVIARPGPWVVRATSCTSHHTSANEMDHSKGSFQLRVSQHGLQPSTSPSGLEIRPG